MMIFFSFVFFFFYKKAVLVVDSFPSSSTVPCQFRILNCRAACSQGTEIKPEKFLHCCKTDSEEVERPLLKSKS